MITDTGKKHIPIKNYRQISVRYNKIPQKRVRCRELILPFKYHLFLYKGLPHDSVVYFPFSIYDYISSVLFKPKGQKYIIGCHGMHLKMGHMLENHNMLEGALNAMIRSVLLLRRSEMANLYCHAINKEQAEYMKNTLRFNEENIFYVPIMIDTGNYRSMKNGSRRLRLVHIGGMGKDMQIVLDVIDLLDQRGVLSEFEFYFIGERDKNAENSYKKFDNVHFLGMIGDKQKFKRLSEMDAMIVPAYETFSKTMLEGFASGLYVLTSKRTASWRDVTDLGIKLTVTNRGHPEEYADQLIRLAKLKSKGKNINPYKRMNARKTAENFDEKVILKKMLLLFLKVINAKPKRQ